MQHPAKAALLLVCLIAVLVLISAWTGSIWWGAFSALVVLVGVREFYLPVTFTLDDQGATSRLLVFERKLAWKSVKRIFPGPQGVFLSPFSRRSRLENFRGFYLRWGAQTPSEEVLRFIRAMIETAPKPQD